MLLVSIFPIVLLVLHNSLKGFSCEGHVQPNGAITKFVSQNHSSSIGGLSLICKLLWIFHWNSSSQRILQLSSYLVGLFLLNVK